MINLIPTTAKRQVIIEYWIRVATVWGWILSVCLVLGSLFILPIYVLIESQINAYQDSANAAIEKIATFENVSLELSRATRQAQLLMSSDQQLLLSELVYLFRSLQGSGVVLSDIRINRTTAGVAPVTLSGVAVDRRALSDFRDRLLSHDAIKSVDFPISNLAKDRDITFTMTVEMTNQPTP